MKTEVFTGWGLRVGGERPYLTPDVEWRKAHIKCTQKYHHPVRVVIIPLAEYKRLLKGESK